MRKLCSLFFCFFLLNSYAQAPKKLNSAEIFQEIKKLNFLGSVLYVGAHPDDENTQLISYFSNEVHARTAYLSLTRGDGGQNLIGPQLREQLGMIRTQELLAAREVDGGEQFFTRANDFGYSKNPKETLEIWDKEKVLSDVVWIVRNFKPDVIINRFDHRTPGSTHGHHTASAMLSMEAFDAAANKNRFSDQLKLVDTFQPKRLYFNTSYWFYGSQENFEKADKSQFISFDSGVYFPLRGLSNPEISSISRSQHQSQGFGSTGSRGKELEYIEPIKGAFTDAKNLFAGIDTTWNRTENGAKIGEILNEVERNYDFQNPAASLPQLINAYNLIRELPNENWRNIKTKQIKEIIYASAGLFLEATAAQPSVAPSENLKVSLEAINRSEFPIKLAKVSLSPNNAEILPAVNLVNNKDWQEEMSFTIPKNTNFTSPYWLREEASNGMYKVENQKLIGLPETPLTSIATFYLDFDGTAVTFKKPIVYKFNNPVYGETYQPFEIIPAVSLAFDNKMIIFEDSASKNVSVKVTSGKANVQGQLSLSAKNGWEITPETHNFQLQEKGSSVKLNFKVSPPQEQQETYITPIARVNGEKFSEELISIDYKHIPKQNLVKPAKLKVARLEIEKKGKLIGYIEGAGDVVPESLEQIGYQVTKLDANSITEASLKKYDAVVLGIRAYNTVNALKYKHQVLFDYVKNGGNLITQYNTNRGLVTENIAPLPLKISRDRVTDENAEIKFLAPENPILNTPNKITKKDFENWVQERGLYFPDSWGEAFTPVLSMHDAGESPKNGSLLVANYGQGYFIYTGISFFRQFPAGVPGAYRLFANMISIGK